MYFVHFKKYFLLLQPKNIFISDKNKIESYEFKRKIGTKVASIVAGVGYFGGSYQSSSMVGRDNKANSSRRTGI